MGYRPWIWRIRLAGVVALMVFASGCAGHAELSDAIDELDLPGDLIEVAVVETGPDFQFAGDRPYVSKYYASLQGPETTCEALRTWALDRGMSEEEVHADGSLTCSFNGTVDSNWTSILVSPPVDAIPGKGGRIPVEVEHAGFVHVEMS